MKKLLIVILVLSSSFAFAKNNFREALVEAFPTVQASRLNNCMTCHTKDKWQRNPYGLDMQNWLQATYPSDLGGDVQYSKQMIIDSLFAVQDMDSDKDGFTNIQEIEAKTLPGDANSFPKK